jgi:hypothetical protein
LPAWWVRCRRCASFFAAASALAAAREAGPGGCGGGAGVRPVAGVERVPGGGAVVRGAVGPGPGTTATVARCSAR